MSVDLCQLEDSTLDCVRAARAALGKLADVVVFRSLRTEEQAAYVELTGTYLGAPGCVAPAALVVREWFALRLGLLGLRGDMGSLLDWDSHHDGQYGQIHYASSVGSGQCIVTGVDVFDVRPATWGLPAVIEVDRIWFARFDLAPASWAKWLFHLSGMQSDFVKAAHDLRAAAARRRVFWLLSAALRSERGVDWACSRSWGLFLSAVLWDMELYSVEALPADNLVGDFLPFVFDRLRSVALHVWDTWAGRADYRTYRDLFDVVRAAASEAVYPDTAWLSKMVWGVDV